MKEHKGIKNCTGCEACVVACKKSYIKTELAEDGVKHPTVISDACFKCNACKLYCPEYFPVDLPKFEQFYETEEDVYNRDMPSIYRQTMRKIRAGEHTEFIGTLCQIAGLKSLLGDKLPTRLALFPIKCDISEPKREACRECRYY